MIDGMKLATILMVAAHMEPEGEEMDTWAINARNQVNEEFDEGIELLVKWKNMQLRIREVIENVGTQEELRLAHKEESELRNSIQRWAAEL